MVNSRVGTVNPLGHWLRIPFGTISRISLRELSGFRGIGFWIPLRRLSWSRVPPGLVIPEQPLIVPVHRYFDFYMYFVVAFTYLGLIVLWSHIGYCFVTESARFFSPFYHNMWK